VIIARADLTHISAENGDTALAKLGDFVLMQAQ